MDQLEAMRVFVAIAERGGFSPAARALGIPVASASRKLAALESHLGSRLLSRSSRRVALTEAGRRHLEACRRLLALLVRAEQDLRSDPRELRGGLAVTAPVVFGRLHVLPVLGDLLARHPGVDARLVLADRVVDLIEEGIDVAVRIGALPDSSLVATRVGATRLVACASPAYLARRGTPRAPEELAEHECITFSGLASPERWSFPGGRTLRAVTVHTRLLVNTAEAAVDAAVAGLGVARVLSYQAAAALAGGSLVRILLRFEPRPTPIHVVHGQGRAPRPEVREFVRLAAAALRPALAAAAE